LALKEKQNQENKRKADILDLIDKEKERQNELRDKKIKEFADYEREK